MKTELFLAFRYIKQHMKQYLSSILVIGLFLSALITTFIIRESMQATFDMTYAKKFGLHTGTVHHADPEKVQQHQDQLIDSQSGLITAEAQVKLPEGGKKIYLGQMDDHALALKMIETTSGRFPTQPGEIALEPSVLPALGLGVVSIGDSIEIPLIRNGIESNGHFTVVGILKEYLQMWEALDASKTSLIYPPPALLTVAQPEQSVDYVHVLCNGVEFKQELGGFYDENIFYLHNTLNEDFIEGKKLLDTMTLPFLILFVVIMSLGISSILIYTLKARKQHLLFLRCVGLKRSAGRRLLMIHGMSLFLGATLLGSLFSVGFSLGITLMLKLSNPEMLYKIPFYAFGIGIAVEGFTILMIFLVFLWSFFRKKPLETGKNNHRRTPKHRTLSYNLFKTWISATKHNHRTQNIVTIIMIASCFLVTVGGTFLSLFTPRAYYDDAVIWGAYEQEAFLLYIAAGTSEPENFHLYLPRETGISQQHLNEIYETQGLVVNFAKSHASSSHFFLYRAGDPHPYFPFFMQPEYQYDLKEDITPQVSTAIEQAGGQPGDLLVEAHMTGLDYHTVNRMIHITQGELDQQQFVSGRAVVAPNTYQIGDTFTMVTPLLAHPEAPADSPDRFDFVVSEVTVTALYEGTMDDKIILSAEYIMNTDPSAKYDAISIGNEKHQDKQFTQQATQMIERITANSSYTSMRNRVQDHEQYLQDLRSGQLKTMMGIVIFIVLILVAIVLSAYVKIFNNIRNYTLLRAIGANQSTIKKLIESEYLRLLIWGSTIGTSVGMVFLYVLVRPVYFNDFPLWDIIAWTVGMAVLLFGVLFFLIRIAIKKPVDLFNQTSITQDLTAVEL